LFFQTHVFVDVEGRSVCFIFHRVFHNGDGCYSWFRPKREAAQVSAAASASTVIPDMLLGDIVSSG